MRDRPIWSRVSRCIWRSTDFRGMGALPPSASSLWLFLLTGEHSKSVPGLFVLGNGTIRDDLHWTDAAIKKHLATLVEKGHVKVDSATNLMWLPNALDHNFPDNPNMVAGWKRDWHALPDCPLKSEALVGLRRQLALVPPKTQKDASGNVIPPSSMTPYADSFDIATGARPPNPSPNQSGKHKGNLTVGVDGNLPYGVGGNVTPIVPTNVDLTERERERERERESHPRAHAHEGASEGTPPAATEPGRTMTKTEPAPDPGASTVDPESTDPTDLLNALANSSNNVFDRFNGAGTDVERQFQRRLMDYKLNVRRVLRLGPILAKHATTMPKMWVKPGEKIRMSMLMGPSGANGQRGGTWLGVSVGLLEVAEVTEAKRVAAAAAPQAHVVHKPAPISDDAKSAALAAARAKSIANKSATDAGVL